MDRPVFLKRVEISNYKNIGSCNVQLNPLLFVVGPNGSGKSNFLDAFRFIADSLSGSLDHALRDRGGIKEVRRRSNRHGHPTHFSITCHFHLPTGVSGSYGFKIGSQPHAGFEVQEEDCSVFQENPLTPPHRFRVRAGKVETSAKVPPPAVKDRLYLVNAAGLPEFRPVYDAFSRMGFYNLNPAEIRDLQQPDSGELLDREGKNLASVLGQLASHEPKIKERMEEYLEKVVPGVFRVDRKANLNKETLEFHQRVAGGKDLLRFTHASDPGLRGGVSLSRPRHPHPGETRGRQAQRSGGHRRAGGHL